MRSDKPKGDGSLAKKSRRDPESSDDDDAASSSDSSDSSSEADDGDDDGAPKSTSEQEFSFEFSDFSAGFIDGIELLLRSTWRSPVPYQLATVLANQGEVGTIVHCEGESDVFAFASIMPFSALQQQLQPIHAEVAGFRRTLENQAKAKFPDAACGLLLHSRFSNLPGQLLVELHKNLLADVEWVQTAAGKQSADEGVAEAFEKVQWVLSIAVCGCDGNEAAEALKAGRTDVELRNPEDELFLKHSVASVITKLNKSIFSAEHAVIMIVPVAKLQQIVSELG